MMRVATLITPPHPQSHSGPPTKSMQVNKYASGLGGGGGSGWWKWWWWWMKRGGGGCRGCGCSDAGILVVEVV